MSSISESLKQYALVEKRAHEEYVRDFTTSMVANLVQGGVNIEKAAFLAKEACLRDEKLVKSITHTIILEKTAAYIESIETENVELATKVAEAIPAPSTKVELPEHLKKLASLGFTEEELAAFDSVPDNVMQKMASAASEPWELGRGVGAPVAKMDPFLEFLMS